MNNNLNEGGNYRRLEKEKNIKDLANLYNEGAYIPTGEVNLLDFFKPLPDVSTLVPGDVEKIKALKGAQLDALIRKEKEEYNLSPSQFKDLMLVPVCTEYFLKLGSKEVSDFLEKNGGKECIENFLNKLHPNIRKGLEQEAKIFENIEKILSEKQNLEKNNFIDKIKISDEVCIL